MPVHSVPVSMGSPRSASREVGAFLVTRAWFPPGLVLPRHVHERPIFGVMLDGSFDTVFDRRSLACPPSTMFTEPAGEGHGNRIQRRGAHVFVIQPDPSRRELLRPLEGLLGRVHQRRLPALADLARRLLPELREPDDVASLVLEAGVLEMLGLATRHVRQERGAPAWLMRAREIVEDRFRDKLRIEEIAREVGVHPAHLARAFRGRFGEPLGARVRRRRLEWAAAQLVSSAEPLAAIAIGAGFADQSHFTRAFRARTGMTPGEYRRLGIDARPPASR